MLPSVSSAFRQSLPIERLLVGSFLLAVVSVAMVAMTLARIHRDYSVSDQQADELVQRMHVTALTHSALKDIELAEREYRLEGQQSSHQQYQAALLVLHRLMSSFDNLRWDREAVVVREAAQAFRDAVVVRMDGLAQSFAQNGREFRPDAHTQTGGVFEAAMAAFSAQRARMESATERYAQQMNRAVYGACFTVLLALALAHGLIVVQLRARQAATVREAHAARHDVLTGLPNRAHFEEWLHHVLADGRRSSMTPALIYMDLDGFKPVNDGHGHRAGDHVLVEVAKRLRAALREGDLLARLGGDEFVAVMRHCGDMAEAGLLAQRLIDALSTPISFEGTPLRVGASAGVAKADAAHGSVDALLGAADAAMYRAKVSGKSRVCV
jgi:diguanylate cyclase (GGDEF)-like protein